VRALTSHQLAAACLPQQASSKDYARILQPHLHAVAAANGSGDDADSFSDGLAEDNATMLSMLRKDGLLAGPLLLALQLYFNKAVGSKGKGGGSGAKLDRAAALKLLTQLSEQQQLELRRFLLHVSGRGGLSMSLSARVPAKHAASGGSVSGFLNAAQACSYYQVHLILLVACHVLL
jgi:hypothetical protein